MDVKPKKYWKKLIGNSEAFSIEERIFHGICIIAACVLIFAIPINFYIELYSFGYIVIAMLTFLSGLFFLSRKARLFKLAKYIFALCIYIINVLSYFFNVGIEGTTIIVFILTFHMIISIMPKRNLWVWLLLHSALAVVLITFEYFYPNFIIDVYRDRSARFIDIGATLAIALFALFLLTKYLRNNYLQEHSLAKKRLTEIEKINLQINLQKKELELSNSTKDKFFSIIAHDLINPFNSIIGFTDLLEKRYDKFDDEKRKKFIHEINQSAELTLNLLNNLLSWARSQTNKIQIEIVSINLFDFIDSTISPYLQIAINKQIEIENNIDDNTVIKIDVFTISTIISNLLSNAIKFTPIGGKVSISYKDAGDLFQIIIADNGQGIDSKKIKNLFDIDTSSNTLGTEGEKGTGLGLLLCKEFVDLNNGEIKIESKLDIGSTFKIILPKLS